MHISRFTSKISRFCWKLCQIFEGFAKTFPLLLFPLFGSTLPFCCLGKPSRRDSGQFTCSVLAEIAGALGSLQDSGVSAKRGASGSNCAVTWVADWRMGMDGPTSTLVSYKGFVDSRVPWNYGNSWGRKPPPKATEALKAWLPSEATDGVGWGFWWLIGKLDILTEKNLPPPFRMVLPYVFISLGISKSVLTLR